MRLNFSSVSHNNCSLARSLKRPATIIPVASHLGSFDHGCAASLSDDPISSGVHLSSRQHIAHHSLRLCRFGEKLPKMKNLNPNPNPPKKIHIHIHTKTNTNSWELTPVTCPRRELAISSCFQSQPLSLSILCYGFGEPRQHSTRPLSHMAFGKTHRRHSPTEVRG